MRTRGPRATRGTRALWTGAIVALGLLPSAMVVRRALADAPDDDADAETTPVDALSKRKKAVLAAITADETALINVTQREMPASPDVLNLGKRGTKALARCVADNVDDGLRSKCAALLGRLGDRAALPALQGALEAWNPSVRGAAIDALRRIPDAGSVAPLVKLLQREDENPENRAAALEALGAMSDTKALGPLRAFLHDDGALSNLRPSAFAGLWRARALMARQTLIDDVRYALQSNDESLIVAATYAAAELRAPALVGALVPLMGSVDGHVRNRAVYALGRIGDRAATKALVAQIPKVREARMLNNIAFALERLDPAAFYATIPQLMEHKQAAIRMNAAFVLGDVRRPAGLPLLEKALGDQNDYVRVGAVSAIGKLDAPEAIPVLEKYVDDKNGTLRTTAIYAIWALSDGKRADLLWDKLYSPPTQKPTVKLEAALALARARDPRVAGDVVACIELQGCRIAEVDDYLRALGAKDPGVGARMLLQWAKGRDDLTDLVGALRPAGAGPLALADAQASLAARDLRGTGYALDLAGDVPDAAGAGVLRPLLAHDSARIRLHAAIALVRLGGAAATEAEGSLWKDLDMVPEDRLPSVARVLARITEPAVRARLLPTLVARESSPDPAIALAAAAVHLSWDADAAFFRLLDAIATNRSRDRELATLYLMRDHRPLVTALMRRALAREERPPVRDLLRKLVEARAGHDDAT